MYDWIWKGILKFCHFIVWRSFTDMAQVNKESIKLGNKIAIVTPNCKAKTKVSIHEDLYFVDKIKAFDVNYSNKILRL